MQARLLESCVICGNSLGGFRLARRTCGNAACMYTYQQHLRAGRPTCTECGRPLSQVDESHGARSCRDVRCQLSSRLNAAIADEDRCGVCRMRLPPDCTAEGVCRELDCRAVHAWRRQNELAKQRLERYLQQTQEATLLRDAEGPAAGITSPDTYFVTLIPLLPNRLAALPAERREEFRMNIAALVGQLEEQLTVNPIDEPPSPVDSAAGWRANREAVRLVSAVCATCRGHCCRHGDTHAYLKVETLHRFLQRRPEIRLEQLSGAYLDCLPQQSFSDSCVFHGETGCTLPSEMRSDTCNNHFCAGQQSLHAAIEQGAPPRAFVAVSDGTQIVAGQFYDAGATSLAIL